MADARGIAEAMLGLPGFRVLEVEETAAEVVIQIETTAERQRYGPVASGPTESLNTFTGRTAVATAELLGQRATVFPSHHGGFLGGEFGYAGQPEAFARRLRDVLDDDY